MKREEILDRMQGKVAERGCFIVDAEIGKDDDITLTLDKENGSVSLEDCEAINDAFLAVFDKDSEDYSLTVTSAGLDQPFKVLKQFQKAIGSQVEVRLRNGKKIIGLLSDAAKDGITLRYSLKEVVEGKKRNVLLCKLVDPCSGVKFFYDVRKLLELSSGHDPIVSQVNHFFTSKPYS